MYKSQTGRKPGLMVLCGLMAASICSGGVSAAPRVPEREPIANADARENWRQTRRAPEVRVIVKLKERKGEALAERIARRDAMFQQHGLRLGMSRGLERVRTIVTGAELVRFDERWTAEEVARALAADPEVEYAEPDRMLRAYATPNDTQYSSQWHYFEAAGGLNLPAAWDESTGSGARVAVLDTGYRPHVDLAGNIVGGYDFIGDTFVANDGNGRDADAQDPGDWINANECGGTHAAQGSSWHGTHVAGTVAAVTNNSTGVAGVAYGAKVVPVRVLGKCGGYTSDIADAIVWAAGGSVSGVPANAYPAKVVNLSLGGGGACDNTSQTAINTARSLGATVVVAAGNENQNASNSSPANCAGVVTVAAVDRQGGRAYYSNYGSVVDVAAPGGAQSFANDPNGILSTANSGSTTPGSDTYEYYQGTSMATPHVAGVVALMLAGTPGMSPDQVESTLKSTARSFPATCSGCGAGIVDAAAAVGGGTPPPPPDDVLTDGVAVTNIAATTGTELRWTMSVPSGQSSLTFNISGGSGDADLYVKFGSAPTTASYDCRPYKNGNTETCSFTNPAAGTWHVMLRAYSSFSGVSLVGDHAAAPPSSCPTGYTEYTGSLSSGGQAYKPGTGGTSAAAGTHNGILTGPTGTDFDLYLQKRNNNGSWSTVRSGTTSSSSENVSYTGTSGTYRWRVYAYSGSGAYTLCARKP